MRLRARGETRTPPPRPRAVLLQPLVVPPVLPPTFCCLSSPAPKSLLNSPSCSPVYWHRVGGDLGHVGSPWGSAEPGQPRAVMPATARRPEAGQEMCYAITVLGVFITLGSACWKMLPRPPSKICSF